jgi:uncharacterized protein involved in exopolysaccharide biosynthesis
MTTSNSNSIAAYYPAYYTNGFEEKAEAHPSSAHAPPRGFTMRDVLIHAFYNKRMIRNFVIAGLGMGVLAAALSPTQYTAHSLLLMMNGSGAIASDLSGGGGVNQQGDALKAMQSEVQFIQSDDVLRRAVERAGAETLFPAVNARRLGGLLHPLEPIQRLHSNLRVEAETGTNVIKVSYNSSDRDLAIRTVQAVVDSYLDWRRTLYASASTSTLGRQIEYYATQLQDNKAKIEAVRNQYRVLDITQDVSQAASRLEGVAQRQDQVREHQTIVHAEMLAAQAQMAIMPQQVFESKETSNNAPNDDGRNTLLRLEQDREHIAAQYGVNWPSLREQDQKISVARSQISENSHGTFFTSRNIRNPIYDQMAGRLATISVEDQSLGKQLAELNTQYKQAEQRVQELRGADSKLHDLQRNREVAENIYKQLSLKQAESQVRDTAANGGDVDIRVAQPANAPLNGHNMAFAFLAAGLMFGIVSAVAASVIATLVRQVYIMPSEVEHDLNLPSIVNFDTAASDFESRAGQKEIRNLAAYLLDVRIDGRPLSVVQVVSATEAEGKTALVRALAAELSKGHGLRTLIMDMHSDGSAETEVSDISKIDVPNSMESTDLAMRETDISVVATDVVPRLWMGVSAARESLGSERTLVVQSQEVLEDLRQRFNMVLIISPPNISEYTARRLSSLVDANLLVIRSEHTRSPVAMQMRDTILAAGGNLLGFAYTWRRYHIPQAIYRWL